MRNSLLREHAAGLCCTRDWCLIFLLFGLLDFGDGFDWRGSDGGISGCGMACSVTVGEVIGKRLIRFWGDVTIWGMLMGDG